MTFDILFSRPSNWQDFRNNILPSGRIEKIYVANKSTVRYLDKFHSLSLSLTLSSLRNFIFVYINLIFFVLPRLFVFRAYLKGEPAELPQIIQEFDPDKFNKGEFPNQTDDPYSNSKQSEYGFGNENKHAAIFKPPKLSEEYYFEIGYNLSFVESIFALHFL